MFIPTALSSIAVLSISVPRIAVPLFAVSSIVASPLASLPPTSVLVGLAVVTTLVAVLLFLQRPTVTHVTALAMAPWAVAGGLLHVLAVRGAYPPTLAVLFATALVPVSTFAIAGLTWTPLLQIATLRGRRDRASHALGVAGVGVTAVLAVALVLRVQLSPTALLWLAVTPIAAALLAATGFFLLGLRFGDALAYTGLAGLLVAFGQAFDGLALAVAADQFGFTPVRPIAGFVLDGFSSLLGTDMAPWALLGVKLALALGLVALLTAEAREGRPRVFALLGLLAAAGIGPAVVTLVLATTV